MVKRNKEGNEIISVEDYKEIKNGYEAFNVVVTNAIKIFEKETLNRHVYMEIYTAIYNAVYDLLVKGHFKLTNDAVNYIAQSYWDMLSINNSENGIPDDIFTKRITINDIPIEDVAKIFILFRGSPLCIEAAKRLRRS